jgi:hypothetical protein
LYEFRRRPGMQPALIGDGDGFGVGHCGCRWTVDSERWAVDGCYTRSGERKIFYIKLSTVHR